jgi:secretion/DNA translocation related TadE-like protein
LRDERGSGTVLATGLLGVLATMCLAILLLGGALVTRGRAQSAADLAALAGAGALIAGQTESDACAVARRVGRENDAELTICHADAEGRMTVEALVSPYAMDASTHSWGLFEEIVGPVRALAQAGPPRENGAG